MVSREKNADGCVFIAIANETERGAHLRKTFATMPQRHQDCLEFLMFHLTRVAQREPENLVSPLSLPFLNLPTGRVDIN